MATRRASQSEQGEPRQVLTAAEAADFLTVSRAQLYKLIREGVFQPIRLSKRRVVFLRDHLEARLKELLAKQYRRGK
jgi:predicted DNA-binding transcriptional regulator AlpA